MKELVIGSPNLLSPNPTPSPTITHKTSLRGAGNSTNFPNSGGKSAGKPWPLDPAPPPLLMNVRRDLTPRIGNRLKYYTDLASKLAESGRFEEFMMVAESVLVAGADPANFSAGLSAKLVSAGFSKLLRDGKLETVLEVLSKVQKQGICPSSLFDRSARQLLVREFRRVADDGKMKEFVGTMEILAGYQFSVKDFGEPSEILKTCVKTRDPKMAVRYASILPHSHVWFSSIIREFGKRRDFASALIAFEASKLRPRGPNMYIYRSIIDACGFCGDFLKSRHIFEELLVQKITPNTFVFNSLMNVNAHDLSYTLHVYKHMQLLGVTVDTASYNILLKACCLAGSVDLAQEIYKEIKHMVSAGRLKLDVITYSTIMKVFADAKMWKMALKIKEDMLAAGVVPNIITWSSLISACANAGLVEQAIRVFEDMVLAGCEPNPQCCNILLHACVESCQYDRAFRLFYSWKENGFPKTGCRKDCSEETNKQSGMGVKDLSGNDVVPTLSSIDDPHHSNFDGVIPFTPTAATYNILMKACGTDCYRAKALMEEMKLVGLSPNHISWSILIDIFGSSRNMRGAMQAFKTMQDTGINPDVVAYTTAIKACVGNKNLKMAFSLFEEMKRCRVRPNLVTYNTLLRARSKYGSLHEVQQCLTLYQEMRKAGYRSNDYFLKGLLEEWSEGVIKDSNQHQGQLAVDKSCDKDEVYKPQNLLIEKVCAHLGKDIAENLMIDIQGLTKVEARIVVLAVLRIIKESYTRGHPIKDDMMIIISGDASARHKSEVQEALIKVLQDELGLCVSTGSKSEQVRDNQVSAEKFGSSARRPTDLVRVKVTKESLYQWLQKRVHATRKQRSLLW